MEMHECIYPFSCNTNCIRRIIVKMSFWCNNKIIIIRIIFLVFLFSTEKGRFFHCYIKKTIETKRLCQSKKPFFSVKVYHWNATRPATQGRAVTWCSAQRRRILASFLVWVEIIKLSLQIIGTSPGIWKLLVFTKRIKIGNKYTQYPHSH